jgi:zinc protease
MADLKPHFARFVAAAVLLLAAGLAAAQTRVASIEGVNEYRLANGLRVLVLPDPGVDTVTVHIIYLVGSRHEGYGEKGMAHLLEHLLFKGSTKYPDVKEELTRRGARWNGTTSNDRTTYFETLSASGDNLDWALSLEADRMLHSRVARADLDAEMTVVRNEFEMGENNAGGVLLQRMQQLAFPWHNYGNPVIGERADIERVPIDKLQAFYRTWYQPDNAVLIVAGRFDERQAMALVTKYFAPLPKPKRVLPTFYTEEPTQDGERTVTLRRSGDTPIIATLYRLPAASHPDYPAIDVLVSLLGDAPSGRLHRALVQKNLATYAFAAERGLHDPGFAYFGAGLARGADTEPARRALIESVENLKAQPVQAAEMERARTILLNEFEKASLDTATMVRTLSEFAALGDWRLFYLYRDRLKKVSLEDVQRVAETYLKPANRVYGVFVPTEKVDRAAIPETPDLQAALEGFRGGESVKLGEAFDPSPKNIEARLQRAELANGIHTELLPKKTRGGRVVASLTLHWGDEKRLTDREVACDFAGAMLMRGTQKKSRAELKDAFELLNASVSVSGDGASIEVRGENLVPALRLVAEVLREPAFPASEFEELKRAALAGAEEQKSDPSALASVRLSRHLQDYPKGHPLYTPTIEERIEWTSKTTLKDAIACYRDLYGATGADFVAVGDFDPQEVKRAVEELFGAWRSPSPFQRVAARYFDRPALDNELLTPDKANAVLRGGHNFRLREDDPDFAAMVLANYLLGGSSTARLPARVREKEGLSYSTYTTLRTNPFDDAAVFGVSAIFAPQNRARVEQAVREEIVRAVQQGFSPAEVTRGKQAVLEARRLARTQDRSLASRLAGYSFARRTFAWDIALEERIAKVTPAELNAVLKKYIDPSRLALVAAGDFRKGAASSTGPGSPPAAAPGAAAAPRKASPRPSAAGGG